MKTNEILGSLMDKLARKPNTQTSTNEIPSIDNLPVEPAHRTTLDEHIALGLNFWHDVLTGKPDTPATTQDLIHIDPLNGETVIGFESEI